MSANLVHILRRGCLARSLLDATTKATSTQCMGSRKISTTGSLCNDKVYELRTYSLQAKDMKPFMEMSCEWMHLRTAHSKLIGYWTSEIGGINDVVHIWEYDSLSHRAGVRQALAGDPLWVGNYFSKLLPMLVKQDNSLMKCLPGTSVADPPSKGVYEIQHFSYNGSDIDRLSTAAQSVEKNGGTLLGSFYTVIGWHSTGCQLWFHPNVDSVVQNPRKAPENSGKSAFWALTNLSKPSIVTRLFCFSICLGKCKKK